MLPLSLLSPTFFIRLIDSLDFLVVPRSHDFDKDFLICAGPLEESGMTRCCGCQSWVGTQWRSPTHAR